MIPKRIAVKNFLAFGEMPGNKPVEFVFSDGEPLWVLCGANGTGKSAVFDAITYALYGEHRGGKIKAEQLIRHNANGFEVTFEFEFNRVDYRVSRTRPRKGRTTQHLLKQTNGEWKCIRGNDPAGQVDAADIKEWVSDTLGLGYDAFTNSVLLQQGKADKLFTASRDERIEVLKGIIGFEQFEALSDRVGVAAKERARNADGLLTQRDAIPSVSDDDLKSAETAVQETQSAVSAAQGTLAKANERVTQARQWEKAEGELKELTDKIAAADERQRQGRKIRADKQALDSLTVAVPVLEKLFKLRDTITQLKRESKKATDTVETKIVEREAAQKAVETAREKTQLHKDEGEKHATIAKGLASEIKQGEAFLAEADAIAGLAAKLETCDENLDALLSQATSQEEEAETALQTANADATRTETLLSEAAKQQTRFAGVKVGVECPHCRQPVDETHATKFRADFAEAIKLLQGERDAANTAANSANEQLMAVRMIRARLQLQKNEREKLIAERNTRQSSLNKLGVTADAAELRTQLKAKEQQKLEATTRQVAETQQHKTATADLSRIEIQHKKLDAELKAAEGAKTKHDNALATASGQEQTTLAQLTQEWNDRLPQIDGVKVEAFAAERDRLLAENVTEKFKELEQDETRRVEWEKRRDNVHAEIAAIDEADRLPEVKAKEQQAQADKAAKEKQNTHTVAVNRHTELSNGKLQRETLTLHHRDAAERQRLHAKLDKLLGDAGLQLELVRDAEEQIIAFANETLQHLSDGDLSLEEDTAQDASTKTFDLRARRGGGEPIGVAFLSGSQRFRVAVSIALAVGRFASGRSRPLEAVIIDEGFGSLDPQGLQAMATELKRLQQAKSLQRVILVSHQPDFIEQFSVGYTLTVGENGTTATAFRR
ncbi:MAG: hypothetical protein C0467_21660 [Planctomycetaceae bacterium]|nr:hypothetical protein [Planctomycetaceae bacterium]